ncbi:hypothetical protein N7532_004635 [Penicillium argentinense]|uniref:Uncharacterized protein n=1 Tax=Penicillium argentinense TaxID=1131581 RepID=A0A9W9FPJ9_9EURO|nr:uncharacterized protein N7532_004635 [Penicillium argentinense]KAJ5104106.1 hypothetical protein N7532_004635 [Penicillium argentinense]
MSGAASVVNSFDWLSKFRQAGKGPNSVNASLIWELARHLFLDDIDNKKIWRKALQCIELIGEDDYMDQFIPGVNLSQHNLSSISNLGAFVPGPSEEPVSSAGWTISNIEFSTSAWKAGCGADLVFNVAGVRNRPSTINATYEEGNLREDMVCDLLKRVEMRMAAII